MRRRVAKPLDLLVRARVLLDVHVRLGHVSLRLVVVVVADEVLNRVLGEESPELLAKLGGQGLVVGKNQGRPLGFGDNARHRVGLSRAGRAQKRLKSVSVTEALNQPGDRSRLVALRLEILRKLQRFVVANNRHLSILLREKRGFGRRAIAAPNP